MVDALYSRVPRVMMLREKRRAPRFRMMQMLSVANRLWDGLRSWEMEWMKDEKAFCKY